jgi:hypothetical protein
MHAAMRASPAEMYSVIHRAKEEGDGWKASEEWGHKRAVLIIFKKLLFG